MSAFVQAVLSHFYTLKLGDVVDQMAHTGLPLVFLMSNLLALGAQQYIGTMDCYFLGVPPAWQSGFGRDCYQKEWYIVYRDDRDVKNFRQNAEEMYSLHYYATIIWTFESLGTLIVLRLVLSVLQSVASPWNEKFIMDACSQVSKAATNTSDKTVNRSGFITQLAEEFDEAIHFRGGGFLPSGAICTFLGKCFYLGIILALSYLNNFIVVYGTGYHLMPEAIFAALDNHSSGGKGSTLFPFYVGCKIIREALIGNSLYYTAKCTILINKWYLITFMLHTAALSSMALLLFIDIVTGALQLSYCYRSYRMKKWLCAQDQLLPEEIPAFRAFMAELGARGMIMLWKVQNLSDQRVAAEIAVKLWKKYKNRHREEMIQHMINSL